MAPRGHILRPFFTLNRDKIRSKVSFSSILQKFSTGFSWNLFFKLTGTTFIPKCVQYGSLGGSYFCAFFTLNRTKIGQKSVFLSILQKVSTGFIWKLFLKHTGTTLKVCIICAPSGHIMLLGPFWSRIGPKSVKIQVFVYFTKKVSIEFTGNLFF